WLADVECATNELRGQVDSLTAMTPEIDFAEKQTKRIGDSLASIEARREFVESLDRRFADLEGLSQRLDERGSELASRMSAAEKRLDQFEERLEKWDTVDQEVTRSLEYLSSRQDTIDSLRADLDRMFSVTDQTVTGVREITSAHAEIARSRSVLNELMVELKTV